ncbi:serum paraoxonase/arylesterase 2-like [Antedon mediterranea]|uniref:serum paraoxonase/arylesterase 2-like n=1 Tax=Antedon mediterranea TaxID=105859 RepID=UPI003AF460D4
MWKKLLFIGFLAIFARHIFLIAQIMGIFKTIHNHKPGPCRVVPGIVNGSEDIYVLPNGLAFISSGISMEHYTEGNDPRIRQFEGGIYRFDFNKPDEEAKLIPIEGDVLKNNGLRPHGLDVWQDGKTEKVRLFVVNHYAPVDVIEVFDFDQERIVLKHHKTIKDKLFYSVNDVAATGPDSFYFTNDGYHHGIKRVFEGLLMRAWSNIGYYDGKEAKIIMDGGHGFNGINMSPDKKIVYVNEVLAGGAMHIWQRESDNSLSLIESMKFDSLCDNVFVDEAGDIWQGCHPIGHMFQSHAQNLSLPSPSQVINVKFLDKSRKRYEISEVLSNDGSLVSGSSVAAYYKGTMLIGTVLDKMAYCKIVAF